LISHSADQPQKLSADTEIEAWREALIKDAEFKVQYLNCSCLLVGVIFLLEF